MDQKYKEVSGELQKPRPVVTVTKLFKKKKKRKKEKGKKKKKTHSVYQPSQPQQSTPQCKGVARHSKIRVQ